MYARPGLLLASAATIGALWAAAPAHAQNAPERDLIGARAPGGEAELLRRGYREMSRQQGSDRIWANWWNGDYRTCLSVVTRDGRYDSIITAPAADCQRAPGIHPPAPPPPAYRPPFADPAYPPPPAPAPYPMPWVGGRPVNLGLMCFGEGSRPTLAAHYGWAWNDRTDRYDYGDHTALARQDFDSSLTLQLWDGGGRIRLPWRLVPPLSSGGVNGWWTLSDVRTAPDMIRASYRLNGINKPQLMIDRRSGRITVTGLGNYSFRGDCDQIGPPNRKF